MRSPGPSQVAAPMAAVVARKQRRVIPAGRLLMEILPPRQCGDVRLAGCAVTGPIRPHFCVCVKATNFSPNFSPGALDSFRMVDLYSQPLIGNHVAGSWAFSDSDAQVSSLVEREG